MKPIKIVDLFAGPGGLGEGFSSLSLDGEQVFKITVSAEKDKWAHQTLRLRSFWRLLKQHGEPMDSLYAYYRDPGLTPWDKNNEYLWNQAEDESLCLELGKDDANQILEKKLSQVLDDNEPWVLIGGPPCQAYSVVGRVRKGAKENSKDPKHHLYKHYLEVIRKFSPSIFVMENVRGLLSCKLDEEHIIHKILQDLASPSGNPAPGYTIHSLVSNVCYTSGMNLSALNLPNFVVQSEKFGIPQARHRVILVGIRNDLPFDLPKLTPSPDVSVWDSIRELSPLRSGISRSKDSSQEWSDLVEHELTDLASCARDAGNHGLARMFWRIRKVFRKKKLGRGGRWVAGKYRKRRKGQLAQLDAWLRDPNIEGWINHETRAHMPSDLRRYAYAATYALLNSKNPLGATGFNLPGLAPNHANWKSGDFDDRFKVQLRDRPATTITSHIAKDGHYFIHPDPTQFRSLMVGEASRLQTFPDNYFFEGPRTEQYTQVGNAVPPLLARQIAECVFAVLSGKARPKQTQGTLFS